MTNLIASTISSLNSLLKKIQVKQFLAVVLVGFFLLTTNVDTDRRTQKMYQKIDETAHQSDSVRPKTTGEWYDEAHETKGAPVERLKNIAEESAKAVKEWGSLYPDTAARSTEELGVDMAK